ncbi:MAG: hypothetical protein WAM14_18995 [Candidatus Nitrosopolaris sp.]
MGTKDKTGLKGFLIGSVRPGSTYYQAAEMLSNVTDKKINYVNIPEADDEE